MAKQSTNINLKDMSIEELKSLDNEVLREIERKKNEDLFKQFHSGVRVEVLWGGCRSGIVRSVDPDGFAVVSIKLNRHERVRHLIEVPLKELKLEEDS